ncbi:MAG: SGNH/GDSL hydrolase family protein [Roseibium sp.]|uniref:SGNH/GDSL hydrolase family protein n=1 Tax=Roseibium sp. TaxID=1936156 RepID=UPI001B14E06B|nr:SGNH/GDSL hydrolase family protein [Roseibium sp.]MBO6894061.1 SGNH/GDSL hydrolase family protein [Roseibium sp.]MBO6933065.1 SGNH/GDSL hydrolase family protein [Roseibium sp.]
MSGENEPISVVCFGDSLTWGFNPIDKSRYGHSVRWTRLLQKELGERFHVVEEGVNGRTTVFEDPVRGDKNGLEHLATVRKTHMPIDVLIIMLGTNDLQDRFSMSADAIGKAMGRLVFSAIQPTDDVEGRAPRVLLMAPPPLGDFTGKEFEGVYSNAHGGAQSRLLAGVYSQLAQDYGVAFFDAGTVISTSEIDAIHFEAAPQADLAKAVADKVRKLLTD